MKLIYTFSVCCFCLMMCHCNSDPGSSVDGSTLIAEVYGKKLYRKDLLELIPSSSSFQDSIALANAYVEQWIREQLLLNEAEKNIPRDLDIEQLVEDYRASLLRFNFEKKVIEEKLDTFISTEELIDFYENNKLQYLLKNPILRMQAAILNSGSENNERIYALWINDEWSEIGKLCRDISCHLVMDSKQWQLLNDIRNTIPENILSDNSIVNMKKIHEKNKDYEYYLKVLDYKDKNTTPPLEYIQDQLTKVILHKRKQKIIQDLTENLYESESRKNNVKVYTES